MLSPNARLHWESVNNYNIILDENTLQPLENPADGNPYAITDLQNYSLAVSGDVFRWIIDFAPLEVLHKVIIIYQGSHFVIANSLKKLDAYSRPSLCAHVPRRKA